MGQRRQGSSSQVVFFVQIEAREYKSHFSFMICGFLYVSCFVLKGENAAPVPSPSLHIYTKSVVFDIMCWN